MKIRNISGEDRFVGDPINRTVPDDGVIEVTDAQAPGLTCQPQTWRAEPTTKKKES